jgi:hypothetical protein
VQTKSGQSTTVLFATIPVWANKTQQETTLTFNKYDDQYFLSQIWSAGEKSGRELLKPRVERQLAKAGIRQEKIVLSQHESAESTAVVPVQVMR